MYATILQSRSNAYGIRQTAVIPNPFSDEPEVYTRTLGGDTKLRGSAGAWLPVSRAGRADLYIETKDAGEVALGSPVSIPMTVNDERDLSNFIKPTTLLQKLARAVQGEVVVSSQPYTDALGNLFNTVDHKPQHLAMYAKTSRYVAPNIEVTIDSVPDPVVVEPAQPAVAESVDETGRVWASLVVPNKPQNHIPRVIDGLDEIEMFTRGIANGDTFLLSGEAGTGKTQSVENLAAHLGLPLVRIEMDYALTRAETEGRLLPTLDGGWRWHYSRLATAVRQPSIILLNELSRSQPFNATLFLGILQERQLQIETLNEVIPVHPECIFIADQNVGQRYVGTREQDPALLERFKVKIEYGDDPNIEAQLIPSPALLEIANALRYLNKQDPAKHRTRVGLRMLINFVKQARVYNFTFAVNRFLANFPEAEREAVSAQFEAQYLTIASELGVDYGTFAN